MSYDLGAGLFVRLGDEPRPVNTLTDWPLPSHHTYRYRRRGMKVQPEDAAELIPPLRQMSDTILICPKSRASS